MTKLKLLSAALIAAAMLAPAMAHESHLDKRHWAEDANASTGARYTGEGDGFRDSRFSANGLRGGSRGYEGSDVWGHWGTYYGPMIPAVP
jgi:hypothetical protein